MSVVAAAEAVFRLLVIFAFAVCCMGCSCWCRLLLSALSSNEARVWNTHLLDTGYASTFHVLYNVYTNMCIIVDYMGVFIYIYIHIYSI